MFYLFWSRREVNKNSNWEINDGFATVKVKWSHCGVRGAQPATVCWSMSRKVLGVAPCGSDILCLPKGANETKANAKVEKLHTWR